MVPFDLRIAAAPDAFFAVLFLAAVFLAARFLAGAFLAAAFFAGAFFAAAFFAGAFLAAAFFAGAFLAALVFAAAFFAGARVTLVADAFTTTPAAGTRAASDSVSASNRLLEFVEALGHDRHLLARPRAARWR